MTLLFESAMINLMKKATPEQFLEAYMKLSTTPEEDSAVINIFIKESLILTEGDRISDEVEKRLTDEAKGITMGLANNENALKNKSRALVKLVKTALSLKGDDIANSTFRHKVFRIAVGAFVILGSAIIPATLIGTLAGAIISTIGVSIYTKTRADKELKILENQINYIEDKLETIDDPKKKYELNKLKSDLDSQLKKGNKKAEVIEKRKSLIKEKGSQYAEYHKDKHLQRSSERADARREKKAYKQENKRENAAYRKEKRRSKAPRNNERGVGFY
jgi:Trp operon repressor